jgi:hypothetical protein
MTTGGFLPSYAVPDAGLDAWASPDATQPVVARLNPRLDVQVLQWWGDWARIRCSNNWEAWTDGRQLVAVTPVNRAKPASPRIPLSSAAISVVAGGALTILIGTVLPWIRGHGTSSSAFKIPFSFLVDYKRSSGKVGVISVGTFLLLLSIGAAGLSIVPKWTTARRSVGGVVLLVSVAFVFQLHRLLNAVGAGRPSLLSTVGVGVFLALAGSVALLTGAQRK